MGVRVHYLTSNDSTWTPPAVISLDTETHVVQTYPEVQRLRCWHVRADYRQGTRRGAGEHVEGGGLTAPDLARRVSKWAGKWGETWLYCHNLNFDLTTTQLPVLLPGHGWTVADMALDGARPWMVLTKDHHKLVIADSYAIWPVGLEEVAAATGIVKPPLPEGDDPDTWMARCAADTLILHTALLTYMAWHDRNQLGRWGLTGATTGWNTMRHLQNAKTSRKARAARIEQGLPPVDPAAQAIVINPDPAGRANDRLAIYGGRRETWRWGKLVPGSYIEADFKRAHQTVMGGCALPRNRGRWFDTLPLDSRLLDDPAKQWGVIAEVEIETDIPRWPCRIPVTSHHDEPGTGRDTGGPPTQTTTRVFYPVGRFKTVLAGPDIAEAKRLGCLRSVGHGQVHQLGYATQTWAQWSAGAQDDPDTPAVVKMALKHQGRAVAGRWAARTWSKEIIGAATTYGWSYEDVYIHETQTRGAIIDLAGTKFLSIPGTDGDNAYPAVLAWIESYTRVALGRAIQQLGADAVVQCDTDGMIVDTSRSNTLVSTREITAPLELRAKTIYRTVEITGPQHLILDGERRWSGIPGSAERRKDGSYEAWTWPKLAWQMSHGDQRGYTRIVQTYRLANSYAPGWLIADGTVAAPEARINDNGATELVPWTETRYAARGDRLAPAQAAVFANLTGPGHAG